ncbi:hypothetical protein RRG08_005401 [Elysia crispata]|uniref:Uncharacterized protein n=1 Tax=Elysia crispata TaxID=231223 RepID=A0AAE0Y0V6_9GAST|nr:hypothetical protein RRG08_005401 [Elysia crispata]
MSVGMDKSCQESCPSNTPSDILLRLFNIHKRTAHPTTAPMATWVKAEKVKLPVISEEPVKNGHTSSRDGQNISSPRK